MFRPSCSMVYSKPQRGFETGLRTIRAGIPYTLLLRIEAFEFPTFVLLLYRSWARVLCFWSLAFYMNYNKEAKIFTFRRGSAVGQV